MLGVLALLGPPQLLLGARAALGGGDRRDGLLALDELGYSPRLRLGLPQALLEAGHVRLERPHRRLGGLRAADQAGVAGLDGAPRPAFGEQVALGSPAAALGPQSTGLRARAGGASRRLASLCHHDARKLRCPPDGL